MFLHQFSLFFAMILISNLSLASSQFVANVILNSSNIEAEKDTATTVISYSPSVGLGIGIDHFHELVTNLFVQSGLSIVQRGFKSDLQELKWQNLQVPLLLRYKSLSFMDGYGGLTLTQGIGKIATKTTSDGSSSSSSFSDLNYSTHDVSFVFGFGIYLSPILIDVRIQGGMVDFDTSNLTKSSITETQLSVGYIF